MKRYGLPGIAMILCFLLILAASADGKESLPERIWSFFFGGDQRNGVSRAADSDVYIDPEYDGWGSFTPDDALGFDRRYLARQAVRKEEGDIVREVYIDIYEADTGEQVTGIRGERARDFLGICWDRDSYDIYIQSADVGIYPLRYTDGEWHRDTEAPVPEYIISEWDVSAMDRLCRSLVGRTLSGVYEEFPVHIPDGSMGYLKFGNGYIVLGSDWETIEHAVGYSLSGEFLCSAGVVPLSAEVFDGAKPATLAELRAAYGDCHDVPTSGFRIWVYYIDDGRIAFFDIYGDDIYFARTLTVVEIFDMLEQADAA